MNQNETIQPEAKTITQMLGIQQELGALNRALIEELAQRLSPASADFKVPECEKNFSGSCAIADHMAQTANAIHCTNALISRVLESLRM